MTGAYQPCTDADSVHEAAVILVFQSRFNAEAVELARGRVHNSWSVDFPESQEIRGGEINIDLSDPHTPVANSDVARSIGFQFSKPGVDDRPSRVLRLSDNTLMASFPKYPGWDVTLSASMGYIKSVLSSFPLSENPIVGFCLKYVDRYVFDGSRDQARAEKLFVLDNSYLSSHCFESGPLWHCHTGWFEPYGENRILNQLNVGSGLEDRISVVTVDHNALFQLKAPRQSVESVLLRADEKNGLEVVLAYLHEQNKRILRDILRKEMINAIGMGP